MVFISSKALLFLSGNNLDNCQRAPAQAALLSKQRNNFVYTATDSCKMDLIPELELILKINDFSVFLLKLLSLLVSLKQTRISLHISAFYHCMFQHLKCLLSFVFSIYIAFLNSCHICGHTLSLVLLLYLWVDDCPLSGKINSVYGLTFVAFLSPFNLSHLVGVAFVRQEALS